MLASSVKKDAKKTLDIMALHVVSSWSPVDKFINFGNLVIINPHSKFSHKCRKDAKIYMNNNKSISLKVW